MKSAVAENPKNPELKAVKATWAQLAQPQADLLYGTLHLNSNSCKKEQRLVGNEHTVK